MKRISIGLILLSSLSNACPTCVGRIENDSPAFFRDDFYAPTTQTQTVQAEKNQKNEQEDQEDA